NAGTETDGLDEELRALLHLPDAKEIGDRDHLLSGFFDELASFDETDQRRLVHGEGAKELGRTRGELERERSAEGISSDVRRRADLADHLREIVEIFFHVLRSVPHALAVAAPIVTKHAKRFGELRRH